MYRNRSEDTTVGEMKKHWQAQVLQLKQTYCCCLTSRKSRYDTHRESVICWMQPTCICWNVGAACSCCSSCHAPACCMSCMFAGVIVLTRRSGYWGISRVMGGACLTEQCVGTLGQVQYILSLLAETCSMYELLLKVMCIVLAEKVVRGLLQHVR